MASCCARVVAARCSVVWLLAVPPLAPGALGWLFCAWLVQISSSVSDTFFFSLGSCWSPKGGWAGFLPVAAPTIVILLSQLLPSGVWLESRSRIGLLTIHVDDGCYTRGIAFYIFFRRWIFSGLSKRFYPSYHGKKIPIQIVCSFSPEKTRATIEVLRYTFCWRKKI